MIGAWVYTLIVHYLLHILHGNIMRPPTARTTRDYDHAPLYCILCCFNQVCSTARYIATPIRHQDNTLYCWPQTSFYLEITRLLIGQKFHQGSGLKRWKFPYCTISIGMFGNMGSNAIFWLILVWSLNIPSRWLPFRSKESCHSTTRKKSSS